MTGITLSRVIFLAKAAWALIAVIVIILTFLTLITYLLLPTPEYLFSFHFCFLSPMIGAVATWWYMKKMREAEG